MEKKDLGGRGMGYKCRNCSQHVGFHAIYKKMICHKCYSEFLNEKLTEEQIEKIIKEKELEVVRENGICYVKYSYYIEHSESYEKAIARREKFIIELKEDNKRLGEENENIENNLHRVQNHLKQKVEENGELSRKTQHYKDYIACLVKEKIELEEKNEKLLESCDIIRKSLNDIKKQNDKYAEINKELLQQIKNRDNVIENLTEYLKGDKK